MKIKFLPFLVGGLFATSLFFTSCLNDEAEEIVLPSETSITSFSIGTVNIAKSMKDSLGKDSAYIDTVSCAHYPFTIDQLKRTIENKDSLPVGSDISRILVNIEADTRAIVYERRNDKGEAKDTVWSPTDSIDFTRPVAFKVFAQNGMSGIPYIAKVNVHKQNPDTLEWSHFTNPNFASSKLNKQKTIAHNQTLYTFGTKSDGTAVVEYLPIHNVRATNWKLLAELPAKTNTYSFQVWKDVLFFVADGKLYHFNGSEEKPFKEIGAFNNLQTLIGKGNISANKEVMFAYTTDKKVIAILENGIQSQEEVFDFIDNVAFESDRLSAACIVAKHNNSLTRTLVMSNSSNANDSIASMFGYTTNDSKWGKITMQDPTVCPNLENISMIHYDNKLYAFGGGTSSKNIKPFEHFYCSLDNGLTWKKVTKQMVLPQEDSPKHPDVRPFVNYYTPNVEGSYSTCVDNYHNIWIVWENGNITKGRLNRLGFAKKW